MGFYVFHTLLSHNSALERDQDNTLQDVHPDQLCSFRTTADLVLEKIFCLQRSQRVSGEKNSPSPEHCQNLDDLFFKLGALPWPSPNSESAHGMLLGSSELQNTTLRLKVITPILSDFIVFHAIIGGVPYAA